MGLEFLTQGIAANPESVLLALKHADRIESTITVGDGDDAKVTSGAAVRAPYDKVLDTLYESSKKLKEREQAAIKRIEEATKTDDLDDRNDDYDEYPNDASGGHKQSARDHQVEAAKQGFAAQQSLLSRTISFVWIALARAMRRIQGKGTPGATIGGLRQVFTDARHRGKLTSDVYVAVALIESVVYKDPVGPKIFERGAKLFPEDANFMIEYLKYLHAKDDTTSRFSRPPSPASVLTPIDARVVFETCANRLTSKPETTQQAKPLYAYFHKYESQYGELSQVAKLEKRMVELFPEDPKLSAFASRYTSDKFDPIAARIIVSPAVQLRPKGILPSIEQREPASLRNSPFAAPKQDVSSPRPQYLQAINSPKRPFPMDEADDTSRPRKLARGESPLKGAAGRRLDQQRRTQAAPLPRDISFLVGILPPPETYNSYRFNATGMVRLIQDTPVPDFGDWRARQDQGRQPNNMQQPRHGTGAPHARQPSGEYSGYGAYPPGRDSPNPAPGHQRPISPYDGAGRRLAGGAGGYRNSPLRPGSSGGAYEPPPAVYRQEMPVMQQYPPPGLPEMGGGWPPAPGTYPPPPPQPQYPRYPGY